VLFALGTCAGTWAIRASRQAAAADRQELGARGLDDGLPMGAFMQDQRIGLEAADSWLVWGTITVAIGVIFAAAGATDSEVGWRFGRAFALVGFVPAAVCFRVGTGTKYWLSSEGIETNRWPRRFVLWADVQRIVPLWRGRPVVGDQRADAIELQTAKRVRGALRWWPGTDLSIKILLVEISRHDLSTMIHQRVRAARTTS
jgi:hypothetical protein